MAFSCGLRCAWNHVAKRSHMLRKEIWTTTAHRFCTASPIFDVEDDAVITCLDLRVAEIERCEAVDGSDKLFLESIDVGENGSAQFLHANTCAWKLYIFNLEILSLSHSSG